MRHLSFGEFLIERLERLHLEGGVPLELLYHLCLEVELGLPARKHLGHPLELLGDLLPLCLRLRRVSLLLLHLDLQVHFRPLRLLLALLQPRHHLLLGRAFLLQLRDTLLHAVDLGIEFLKLVVLRLHFVLHCGGALVRRLRRLLRYLQPQIY